MKILIFSVMFMAVSAGNLFAETMYAKKDQVNVTADMSPTSTVVATLRLGDPVEVIEKSGRQYKVKLRTGKSGWVFKFKLDDKPPDVKKGDSGLSGLGGDNVVVAKEARAGSSIRGLKETTEQYAEKKQISPTDRRSVERMEQRTVTSTELDQFKREGRIGEYAGGAS